MWIRSQDKTKLILANRILVEPSDEYVSEILNLETTYDVISKGYIVGTYSTKEKALKVLDDIQNIIIACECARLKSNIMCRTLNAKIEGEELLVFEMPKDEEVII